jgi:hypothetical protein
VNRTGSEIEQIEAVFSRTEIQNGEGNQVIILTCLEELCRRRTIEVAGYAAEYLPVGRAKISFRDEVLDQRFVFISESCFPYAQLAACSAHHVRLVGSHGPEREIHPEVFVSFSFLRVAVWQDSGSDDAYGVRPKSLTRGFERQVEIIGHPHGGRCLQRVPYEYENFATGKTNVSFVNVGFGKRDSLDIIREMLRDVCVSEDQVSFRLSKHFDSSVHLPVWKHKGAEAFLAHVSQNAANFCRVYCSSQTYGRQLGPPDQLDGRLTEPRLYITITRVFMTVVVPHETNAACGRMRSGYFTLPGAGMITPEEEITVLARAYVPEHSVELITRISGGEPFLFEDYFCCRTPEALIVVGYPLEHDFELGRFERILKSIVGFFQPTRVSLIAPHAPMSFQAAFVERETDSYYTLPLPAAEPAGPLGRTLRKARDAGTIEQATEFTKAHRKLADEFLERVDPPRRIAELLLRMWNYVGRAKDGLLLNAWDRHGKLAAFFVVDLAPKDFATYIIGCYSKRNYVPGASDLLVSELIRLSADLGKRFIHLGIGVNTGIRLFKEKWGGIPTRPYELCELVVRKPSLLDALLGGMGRQ